MNTILSQDLKSKIKGLAYYQILGGTIGIGLTVWLIATTGTVSGPLMLIFLLAIGLFDFSIYCGLQLLKDNYKIALRLSTINQVVQTISFALPGYAYLFASGLLLSVGIDMTSEFKIDFNVSLPSFRFNFNS